MLFMCSAFPFITAKTSSIKPTRKVINWEHLHKVDMEGNGKLHLLAKYLYAFALTLCKLIAEEMSSVDHLIFFFQSLPINVALT